MLSRWFNKPPPPPASPCRRQCVVNDDNLCIGCGRLLSEITEWNQASYERKREIYAAAEGRRLALQRPGPSGQTLA